ncbi:MAG: hypothetical protein MUP30_07100, partial [Deltaproteobacteria bacterium]|nr:hypothetical protein [Deltaproteobacteria bacterium]
SLPGTTPYSAIILHSNSISQGGSARPTAAQEMDESQQEIGKANYDIMPTGITGRSWEQPWVL